MNRRCTVAATAMFWCLTAAAAASHAGDVTPDCNGNLIPDHCDINNDTCNFDTNCLNFEPHCGIPDCNGNFIPDVCDIATAAGVVVEQLPRNGGTLAEFNRRSVADDFILSEPASITEITIGGGYIGDVNGEGLNVPGTSDDLTIIFHENDGGSPGTVIYVENSIAVVRSPTGTLGSIPAIDSYEYTLTPAVPVNLAAGTYWLEIYHTRVDSGEFVWQGANTGTGTGANFAFSSTTPGVSWDSAASSVLNFSLVLTAAAAGGATETDCNGNNVPDSCEPNDDCNNNKTQDICDIAEGTSDDCNGNDIPDICDIATAGGVVVEQLPEGSGIFSEANYPGNVTIAADNFTLPQAASITEITTWGGFGQLFADETTLNNPGTSNDFAVIFHEDNAGVPGTSVYTENSIANVRSATGGTVPIFPGLDQYEFTLTPAVPVNLAAGTYWLEIYHTRVDSGVFGWQEGASGLGTLPNIAWSLTAPGSPPWQVPTTTALALVLTSGGGGTETDCDGNSVPDSCDPFIDCNGNSTPDSCDIMLCDGNPDCDDCNDNSIPDRCDITEGTSDDCDGRGIPDECEIAAGTFRDCNGNSLLDRCEDCDSNSIPDECDLPDFAQNANCSTCCPTRLTFVCGENNDCDGNSTLDSCDINQNSSLDCNFNGAIDECEDCDGDAIPDQCEINPNTSKDCFFTCCGGSGVRGNGDPPACVSEDADGNDIPDECDNCADAVTLSSIASILAGLNVSNASIAALVPDRFDFSDGATGNNIDDGGNDMYDGGNFLNTNLASDIQYTNGTITAGDGLFGPGSQYFTTKHTGLFTMVATDVSIASFTIEGNNGADGSGIADATVLATTRGSQDFAIFVKRVYAAGDPSINHIIVVPGDGSGIIQTFAADTNDDHHFLTGLTGIDQIYYLLVARGSVGLFLEDADIVAIVDEFLRVTFDCNGNEIADVCDVREGTSTDCNRNLFPDECEPDCNGNSVADECDINDGSSGDCNQNVVPDECEDCNGNEIADECEVRALYSIDRSGARLRVISPLGGSTVSTVGLFATSQPVDGGNGLAANPDTGELWGILKGFVEKRGGTTVRSLATINPLTGEATIIGDTGERLAGIAFADGSTLYAITGNGGSPSESLFTLDLSDGSATLVTELLDASDGEVLAFNPDDGLLYRASMSLNTRGGGSLLFTSIDPNDSFNETVIPVSTPLGFEPTSLTYWPEESTFLMASFSDLFTITPGGVVDFEGTMERSSKGLVFLGEATAQDCDFNQVPDECQPDCDGNSTPDACEIMFCEGSLDCADCNGNSVPDGCDIAEGSSDDCNLNGRPDECDLRSTLFGSQGSFDGAVILTINPETGDHVQFADLRVAFAAEDLFLQSATGLALSPDGTTLFVSAEGFFSGGEQRGGGFHPLVTVDTLTGEPTLIGDMGRKISDLAFLPDGSLIGSNPRDSELVDINPDTAETTHRCHTGILFTDRGDIVQINSVGLSGLTTSAVGGVFGSTGRGNQAGGLPGTVFTVSDPMQIEGPVCELVSLGEPTGFGAVSGLDFDHDGRLFGSTASGFGGERGGSEGMPELIEINLDTGVGTLIADIGDGTSEPFNIDGLAFTPPNSSDLDGDQVPDECEDCNGNNIPDGCDIANDTCAQTTECARFEGSCQQPDCNGNTIPDECEDDCNGNSVPDECDLALFAYVSNTDSDDVWVVSLLTQSVVAVVEVGDDPRGIDIAPDNSRVFVASRFDDTISVIDTATDTVVQTIDLGASDLVTATEPYDVVVSPDGEWLYIAMKNGGSENGDGTVVVVDLPAGNVVAEVILDSDASPEGIVVTPDGQKVYVAGHGDMYIVDVSTPTSPVFLGKSGDAGRELVSSPDGAWVYANANVVRTSDDAAFATGDSSGERGIAISPNGLTLFSTDEDTFIKVVSVDLSGATPTTSFLGNIDGEPTQRESYGIDLTDEGDRGVVSYRESDTVRIFDTSTLSFISPPIPMAFGVSKGSVFGDEPKQLVISHSVNDRDGDGVPDDCVEALVCPTVDLVVVMDTSGSMEAEAAVLCAQINGILDGLAGANIAVNVTLLGITEAPGGAFSCLTDDVVNLFGAAVPGSPACCPNVVTKEDWGLAVPIVAANFPWTPGSTRAILAISDEGPEGGDPCDDPGNDRAVITNAIDVANANDVFVATITGVGANACVQTLAADLAAGTGGASAGIDDPLADLANAMSAVIAAICTGAPGFDRPGAGLDDECPNDPSKASPGVCGCGVPDTDSNDNGIPDCIDPDPIEPDPACALCGTVGVAFYFVTLTGYALLLFTRRRRR